MSCLPSVVVCIGDVLATGKSEEEHLSMLEEVPHRIMESGLTENTSVCFWLHLLSILDIRLNQRVSTRLQRKLKQCREHQLELASVS